MTKLKKFLKDSAIEEFQITVKLCALSYLMAKEKDAIELVSKDHGGNIALVKNVLELAIINKKIKRLEINGVLLPHDKIQAEYCFRAAQKFIIKLIEAE